ncbi:GNAT family N-acetyltransferase [Aquimarina spongiae]|uniref:Ribosomal protein S18 acetylase RimI n=1 Tax=Aquimarina spongiae TaxID=570521 RepID=A0A1M6KGI5_9FLAO|nr:GNAT family N-acetyltransferase [Aquimarina spongiae]SHJ58055.1 Ribosomal protein S18 acetylase RimI [Aquimarina spongiae]
MPLKNEIETLNWDSEFFGIRVGKMIAKNNQIDLSKLSDFDLTYIYSREILRNPTLPLYDQKVTFKKKVSTANELSKKPEVIAYSGVLTNELKNLAIASGKYSRFKLDPKLSDYFEKLYILWITNSLKGNLADHILVFMKENKIIGFLSLKKNKSFYQIGLIATSPKHQGLGIGSALLQKAEEIALLENIHEIKVVTQLENEIACNFYKKNSYEIDTLEYIYHYWSE